MDDLTHPPTPPHEENTQNSLPGEPISPEVSDSDVYLNEEKSQPPAATDDHSDERQETSSSTDFQHTDYTTHTENLVHTKPIESPTVSHTDLLDSGTDEHPETSTGIDFLNTDATHPDELDTVTETNLPDQTIHPENYAGEEPGIDEVTEPEPEADTNSPMEATDETEEKHENASEPEETTTTTTRFDLHTMQEEGMEIDREDSISGTQDVEMPEADDDQRNEPDEDRLTVEESHSNSNKIQDDYKEEPRPDDESLPFEESGSNLDDSCLNDSTDEKHKTEEVDMENLESVKETSEKAAEDPFDAVKINTSAEDLNEFEKDDLNKEHDDSDVRNETEKDDVSESLSKEHNESDVRNETEKYNQGDGSHDPDESTVARGDSEAHDSTVAEGDAEDDEQAEGSDEALSLLPDAEREISDADKERALQAEEDAAKETTTNNENEQTGDATLIEIEDDTNKDANETHIDENETSEIVDLVTINENLELLSAAPKDGEIKEIQGETSEQTCLECNSVRGCKYTLMDGDLQKFLCEIDCVTAFRMKNATQQYSLSVKKVSILQVADTEQKCTNCEQTKTCKYRLRTSDKSYEYLCDDECVKLFVGGNTEKYVVKKKRYTIEEITETKESKKCVHCLDHKGCQFRFEQDEDELYICNENCVNLMMKEQPDRFRIKRRSVRVRDLPKRAGIGSATMTVPEPPVEQPKMLARTEMEAETARLDREASFIRTCAQCFLTVVPNERSLYWETLDFCNELCLGQYQNIIGSACTTCQNAVSMPSLGKYCVRFGYEIRQFCQSSCLDEFKKGLKVCSYCQKDISKGPDGFLASIGGQFKDFCSQICMKKYDDMCNPKKKSNQGVCSVCNNLDQVRVEVIIDGRDHGFCSNPCFSAFKFVNNISPDKCAMCTKFFERKSSDSHTIFQEKQKLCSMFCSKICMNIFIITKRQIVPCQWCKVKKYNFDMIEKYAGGNKIMLCSLNCLTLCEVSMNAISMKKLLCDQCGSLATPQYHLTMSDTSMRNFCTYQCVMSFQSQFQSAPLTLEDKVTGINSPVPAGLPKRIKAAAKTQPAPTQYTKQKNVSSKTRKGAAVAPPQPPPPQTKVPIISNVTSLAPGLSTRKRGQQSISLMQPVVELEPLPSSILNQSISSSMLNKTISSLNKSSSSLNKSSSSLNKSSSSVNKSSTTLNKSSTTLNRSAASANKNTASAGKNIVSVKNVPSVNKNVPSATKSTPSSVNKNATTSMLGKNINTYQGSKRNNAASSYDRAKTPPSPRPTTPQAPPAPPRVEVNTQIITVPPLPTRVSNMTTMCKPAVENKEVMCKPTTVTIGCQTESHLEKKFIVPIPVPIYVPMPMHMYSMPVVTPVPIPLPIPVPVYIPTTRNSANGIMKEIKKIQDKMPTDPFEAELLMMAEMVAGDKKKEETESESDDDDDYGTESMTENNALGEDMLQMALKMASEYEEPAVDLESAMTANTITPSSHPHLAYDGVDDPIQHHHMLLLEQQRQMQSGQRGRKRGPIPQNRNSRTQVSPPNKRARRQEMPVMIPQPEPPREPVEKADANMCLKFTFGVNAWKQWVMTKNADLEKSSIRRKPFKSELLQLTADELNYSLCLFVKEVRKPNGSEYAPDTIYYLVLGIQQYLYENGRIDNIFTDPYYEKFTDCLDDVAKKFSVLYNDSQYIVTRVEEEHLWECKQLGAHSPHVLLSTLMFFNTKHFNLTTVEEHMQLSFSHIMKHWKRNPNQVGASKLPGSRNVLLRFYPPQSSLDNNSRKKKVYEQQENEENPLRCPVKLYEFYLSKCPESVKTRNDVFYLQPERSCVPDSPVWYSTQALGKESLCKMLHRVKMVKEINIALLTS